MNKWCVSHSVHVLYCLLFIGSLFGLSYGVNIYTFAELSESLAQGKYRLTI